MRIARFNGGRTGIVFERDGLRVLDVVASLERLGASDSAAASAIAAVLPDDGRQDWGAMIGGWDAVRGAFQSLAGRAADASDAGLTSHALADVALEAPLASPNVHIFAVASNTTVHIRRAMKALLGLDLSEEDVLKPHNDGIPPLGFHVWPSVVVGPDATVTPPRGTQKFDYEGECAVYVKSGGRYLETVDLWGYTAFNDLGVRDTNLKLAKAPAPSVFSFNTPKNFDSGKACGPWVVVDENEALAAARCVLTVNGEVRQDWNLRDMIYGFDESLSFLSQNLTLRPGDMLSSGTGAGVAVEGGVDSPHWLRPGDVIEIKLDGAGTLRSTVGSW